MRYNYGNHVFSLQYHPMTGYHDYQVEIGRSREWEQPEIKTIIGMFFNETFTGMTIKDWGDEENETLWRYVFQSKEVSASAFQRKLVNWLGEADAKKFTADLKRTERSALSETLKFWHRDTAMF